MLNHGLNLTLTTLFAFTICSPATLAQEKSPDTMAQEFRQFSLKGAPPQPSKKFSFSGAKNILFLLDLSDGMGERFGRSETKLDAAKSLILRTLENGSLGVRYELRTLGGGQNKFVPCADTMPLVPFNDNNQEAIRKSLEALHASGPCPLAYALKQISDLDLNNLQGRTVVILITNAFGDSCSGSPCQTIGELLQNGNFKANVVAIALGRSDKRSYSNDELKCLAEMSWGKFYTNNELELFLNDVKSIRAAE